MLRKNATKPKMQKEDRKALSDIFKDDTKNLEEILGRKLPWSDFAFWVL